MKMTWKRVVRPIFYIIGDMYDDRRQYSISSVFYDKYIKGDKKPRRIKTYYRYGRILYEISEFNKAEKVLKITVDKGGVKNKPEYLLRYAQALIKNKKLTQAEAALRESIALNPKRGFVHYLLGVCLAAQKRWLHAEDSLKEAVRLGEETPGCFMHLGQAAFEMRHYSEAFKAYRASAEMGGYRLRGVKERLCTIELVLPLKEQVC